MTAADEPDVPPPVVPGYTLQAMLGRGGSGEVWRAVPRHGGPPVAVKVLAGGNPERQAREAALLGALDHPHLVHLVEVVHQPRRGGEEPRVALVLELLEGGSLTTLLARRGRLRPGEVVTAIAPVAAALAHAHGVVHGDLSPGNIVFTAEGRPVLTDLGVARVLGETAAGEVTPAYVDPTVARGGAPGPASDVFGVAAAAFHALTGIAPWNAATPVDVLSVAAAGELPDLAELAPEAPAELRAVIGRGLSPDPHDRGSAAAFALDLRHACRPEPVRLPQAGGLGASGLGDTGPRTELTHQVPGRHRRAAPVPARSPGRGGRLRRALAEQGTRGLRSVARIAVAGALAAGCLLAAVWAGAGWGGESAETAPAPRPSVAAVASTGPASETVAGSAAPGGTSGAADGRHVPATADAWRDLVGELYGRRAAAFARASAQTLDRVYTADSPQRATDEEQVRRLAAAGEVLRGFRPTVVRVTGFTLAGDRADLHLVDRWPRYDVVPAGRPDGAARDTREGRTDAEVRMVVVRTPEGWRIAAAERPG